VLRNRGDEALQRRLARPPHNETEHRRPDHHESQRENGQPRGLRLGWRRRRSELDTHAYIMRNPAVSAMKDRDQRISILSVASQNFRESSYFRLQPLQFGKSSIQNSKKI